MKKTTKHILTVTLPEQFKEEYGVDYPDDGAVYRYSKGMGYWVTDSYISKRKGGFK